MLLSNTNQISQQALLMKKINQMVSLTFYVQKCSEETLLVLSGVFFFFFFEEEKCCQYARMEGCLGEETVAR